MKSWKTQDITNTNDPQNKYRFVKVSKNILQEGLNWFHDANLTLSSDVDKPLHRKAFNYTSEQHSMNSVFINILFTTQIFFCQKLGEYDHEIPQSHTDQPMAP